MVPDMPVLTFQRRSIVVDSMEDLYLYGIEQ